MQISQLQDLKHNLSLQLSDMNLTRDQLATFLKTPEQIKQFEQLFAVSTLSPIENGGTGITSYTAGDMLVATTSSELSRLADVAIGNALISGGVGVIPSWGKIGITTHVDGLGAGIALFLTTPSSANLAAAVTDETGSGSLVFGTSPTISSPSISNPSISGTSGNVYSDTWTPTLTNTTNISASTAAICQFSRVGNLCTFSGTVQIDPTAVGSIVLGISLPIASNFATSVQAGGTLIAIDGTILGAITSDSTNDRLTITGNATGTANVNCSFSGSYLIV